MLARLWWKEWRSLAPIVITLVVAAVGSQWFLLAVGGRRMQPGILVPVALCFAVLYALAVGSASFAGERENRTLTFLDALPVGRGTLWFGKTSYALVSALVLTLLLRLIGTLGGLAGPDGASLMEPKSVDVFFGLMIAEATVWGLFWSALSKTALTAGILSVLSTGFFSAPSWTTLDEISSNAPAAGWTDPTYQFRLALLVVALGVSWAVTVQKSRTWSWKTRGAMTGSERFDERRRWRPTPAYWSLVWQTIREARVTWGLTVGIGFLAVLVYLAGIDPALILVLASLTVLVQGVSVFGLDTSTGTRAFLDQMAVRPRTVWAAKVTPWALLLLILGAIVPLGPNSTPVYPVVGNIFAVGMLGGMLFARRITATMIAVIVALLIIAPQILLASKGLIGRESLLLSPLVLIAASWFWAGDWLANRGTRRWVKLASLIVVPYSLMVGAFIAGRAWGYQDIGPQFREPASTSALENTTRERILEVAATFEQNLTTANPSLADRWKRLIEELRRKAQHPNLMLAANNPKTVFDAPVTSYASDVLWQVFTIVEVQQERGDLAGSWRSLAAILRLGDQLAAQTQTINDYIIFMSVAERTVDLAVTWASRPEITLDQIRSALTDLKPFDELPRVTRLLRLESERIERSLDEPADRWAEFLDPSLSRDPFQPWTRISNNLVVAPPWERERARRVLREVAKIAIENAGSTRYDVRELPSAHTLPAGITTSARPALPDRSLNAIGEGIPFDLPIVVRLVPPLVTGRDPFDRALAKRRLLMTFLALREWQLTHDGNAPARLEQLPGFDTTVFFEDPFAPPRSPFQYRRVDPPTPREPEPAPGLFEGAEGMTSEALPPPRHLMASLEPQLPVYRVFSVGPNNLFNAGTAAVNEDLGYNLPHGRAPAPARP